MTRIWSALLVANVAWAAHLLVSYALAWAACAGDEGRLLALRHLTTAIAAGAGMVALWRAYRAMTPEAPVSSEGAPSREWGVEYGFLARLAVALSAMLLFAVLLAGAANLLLAPCR